MKFTPALLLGILAFKASAKLAADLSATELSATEAQPQEEIDIDSILPFPKPTWTTIDADTKGIYKRIVYNGTQMSLIDDDAEIPEGHRPGYRVFISDEEIQEPRRYFEELREHLVSAYSLNVYRQFGESKSQQYSRILHLMVRKMVKSSWSFITSDLVV